VWAKRLEQGQFALPRHAATLKQSLSATQLLSLIEGFDILIKRQRKRYKKREKTNDTCYSRPI